MRHQLIPAAGLAATIALCGYMVLQLGAQREADESTADAPVTLPVSDR